jgi:hypothetical protein
MLVMGMVFFALSVEACDMYGEPTVSADCESFTITQTVGAGNPYGKLTYYLTLTSSTGEVIEIVRGPFDIIPLETSYRQDITYSDSWGVELCGTYTLTGTVVLTDWGDVSYSREFGPITIVCPCPPPPPPPSEQCVRTPGYWKNHPQAWPVEEIEIGGVVYSKAKALFLMRINGHKNKIFIMFRALVATKLNLIVGSDPSCIEETVAAAETWMENNVGLVVWWQAGKFTKWGKKSPWREGEPLADTLDDYNNGLLCAPHCDSIDDGGNGDTCNCRGKVTTLTLQYNGENGALVEVVQKKPVETIFSGTLAQGEEFTFQGTDKKGTMGTEISIYVNHGLNTKIHTSCSQPIGPGLISGDFEVIEGESREGGPLCPVTSPFTSKCSKCRKKIKLFKGSFPNPFNPVTTISFALPEPSHVTLEIYNSLGAKVATLADEELSSGTHSVVWNANDYATGMYFCRIKAGSIAEVKKLLYVK